MVTITILIWLCCSKVYCQSSLIFIAAHCSYKPNLPHPTFCMLIYCTLVSFWIIYLDRSSVYDITFYISIVFQISILGGASTEAESPSFKPICHGVHDILRPKIDWIMFISEWGSLWAKCSGLSDSQGGIYLQHQFFDLGRGSNNQNGNLRWYLPFA